MLIGDAQTMGRELLAEHGLVGWRIGLDNAKSRTGQCRYSMKTISLSRPHIEGRDREAVRQTLLHEIAHALVGPGAGHSYIWLSKARSIGYTGKRTSEGAKLEKSWTAYCRNCGDLPGGFNAAPRVPRACRCVGSNGGFSLDRLIIWKRNGVVVPESQMPVTYRRKLADARERERSRV